MQLFSYPVLENHLYVFVSKIKIHHHHHIVSFVHICITIVHCGHIMHIVHFVIHMIHIVRRSLVILEDLIEIIAHFLF